MTTHVIPMTGLMYGRTYYYRVHSGTTTYPDPSQAAQVSFRTRAMGDFDGDGDVDQTDFGQFQLCLGGADIGQPLESCYQAKLDADSDVDSQDVSIFCGCLSGTGQSANPACVPGS